MMWLLSWVALENPNTHPHLAALSTVSISRLMLLDRTSMHVRMLRSLLEHFLAERWSVIVLSCLIIAGRKFFVAGSL